MTSTAKSTHLGRKISRIRELRDMKQEALAAALGVSQQTISIMENSEEVDEGRLQEVAKALGVTTDLIKRFSEEAIFNLFNSFHDQSAFNNLCTFNPLDKLLEAFEENKMLYERLVDAEKDKNGYLERMLAGK